MKVLLLYSLLLLVGGTAERDVCLAQLDDMFFYRLMPLPCNPEHFKNPETSEDSPCVAGPRTPVQMEHVIGMIDAAGELHGDSLSRLTAMGVSVMCIKKIQEQAWEAIRNGEWTAFSVFNNGSVYELVPIVPIFHHRFFRTSTLSEHEEN